MVLDLLWPVGKFCNINTTQFTPLHCRNMQVRLDLNVSDILMFLDDACSDLNVSAVAELLNCILTFERVQGRVAVGDPLTVVVF